MVKKKKRKTAARKRTIFVHDSVNTSKARAKILNQCLKAFTLFMHNLTPTTALDVQCIFGEEQAGGEMLNPGPLCEMMEERSRLIKWPEPHCGQNTP